MLEGTHKKVSWTFNRQNEFWERGFRGKIRGKGRTEGVFRLVIRAIKTTFGRVPMKRRRAVDRYEIQLNCVSCDKKAQIIYKIVKAQIKQFKYVG